MKKYTYEQVNEHIQWLIEFMNIEYPNDFEIILNSNGAEIRSNLVTMSFISDKLKRGEE